MKHAKKQGAAQKKLLIETICKISEIIKKRLSRRVLFEQKRRQKPQPCSQGRINILTQTSQALDDLRSLPHLLRRNASRFPDRPALREKELGIWQTWTWAQAEREITNMALGLIELGVKEGDYVAVIGRNRPYIYGSLVAVQMAGAVPVPLYQDAVAEEMSYVLEHCGARFVIAGDQEQVDKVLEIQDDLKDFEHLIYLDARGMRKYDHSRLHDLRALQQSGLAAADGLQKELDSRVEAQTFETTCVMLYTSGTTGKPKGVQRDTGGYAVALASSIPNIFCGKPGETFFCTSDIGWVVGHSYIIYGPLIGGMATILYEGLPTRPDGGIWWSLVEKYKVTVMFSAPTAIRVLKKQDPALLSKYDLSSLKALFLAGEPLDEPTAKWISEGLGKPIIDNYWQTESGWPILTVCNGIEKTPSKFGSPGKAVYGYDVKLLDDQTGEELTQPHQKGVVAIEGPLPPGCLQTIWGDDERFVKTYWDTVPGKTIYSTFDWGIKDEDGYFFILGRTDDVINVAGHRLGTREIEESISGHAAVAEVAVVGVADSLKGQVAMAFAVLKDNALLNDPQALLKLEGEIMKVVDNSLGAVARPSRVRFVSVLPKTRSGKLLRRAIQAVCEGRDPGDLTTMDDPAALLQISDLVKASSA